MMPLSAPFPRTKRAVVASMRNEGLWILEWLALPRGLSLDTIFLTTHEGQVDDALAWVGPGDGVHMSWKMLGSDGRQLSHGGAVLTSLTMAENALPRHDGPLGSSLFRPERLCRLSAHLPEKPLSGQVRRMSTPSTEMPDSARQGGVKGRHHEAGPWLLTSRNTAINHDASRALDVLLRKNHRGGGLENTRRRHRAAAPFWHSAEQNKAKDRTTLRPWRARAARLARDREGLVLAACETEAMAHFAALRDDPLIRQGLWRWHDSVLPSQTLH